MNITARHIMDTTGATRSTMLRLIGQLTRLFPSEAVVVSRGKFYPDDITLTEQAGRAISAQVRREQGLPDTPGALFARVTPYLAYARDIDATDPSAGIGITVYDMDRVDDTDRAGSCRIVARFEIGGALSMGLFPLHSSHAALKQNGWEPYALAMDDTDRFAGWLPYQAPGSAYNSSFSMPVVRLADETLALPLDVKAVTTGPTVVDVHDSFDATVSTELTDAPFVRTLNGLQVVPYKAVIEFWRRSVKDEWRTGCVTLYSRDDASVIRPVEYADAMEPAAETPQWLRLVIHRHTPARTATPATTNVTELTQ